jgi:hypothetical protein
LRGTENGDEIHRSRKKELTTKKVGVNYRRGEGGGDNILISLISIRLSDEHGVSVTKPWAGWSRDVAHSSLI